MILAIASFYTMPYDAVKTFWFYFLSCFLDALDGYAARVFGQTTKFGGVLDMVTDRCTTSSLFIMLAILYPNLCLVFQLLLCLDMSSHWIHMYTSLSSGSSTHKTTVHPFLKLYYSKPILFTLCAANDSFFCCLYMMYHQRDFLIIYDNKGLWEVLALILLPLTMFKQLTNIIQLIEASKDLVAIDVKERRKMQLLNKKPLSSFTQTPAKSKSSSSKKTTSATKTPSRKTAKKVNVEIDIDVGDKRVTRSRASSRRRS